MIKRLPSCLTVGLALLTVMATATACNSLPDSLQNNAQGQGAKHLQTVSDWKEAGELPLPLESHQMVVLGDFVYLLGGWNETRGPYADVYFTPLTPARTLDNWQATSAPMPLRLQHHAVVVHNDALYVLGGDNGFWDNSTVSDRIFRAIRNTQGDITDWVEVGKLPQPLTIHAVTLIGDQVYVLGGSNTFRPGTQVVDTIFTAPILPDGVFGEFQSLTSFPTSIGWLTATAVGNQIIVISGKVEFSPTRLTETVWAADVNTDNQLSPFESVAVTTPRERHATVLVDRTLVVIAGGGANGALAMVEAAEVDPEGNLIAWMKLPPLPEPRYAHAAFAHDGYIYVSGGFLRYGSNETSRQVYRLPFGK
ncbi:MAG: 4-oxalocrotonate tautomerase [Leptolyngbyaceae cyanobacterium MO_188.B28]|nr:4-oxalocrotonate tautomerase [Leptolyngbyaceae cyanobacterium MO_188.B28]